MRRILFILYYLGAFAFILPAQNNNFEKARSLFRQKQFAAAAPVLRNYLAQRPSFSTRQETEYMLACTAYELQDQRRIETLKGFLKSYPRSSYANRVNALIGSAYFFEQQYSEAITSFNEVDPDRLPDDERDDVVYRMAVSYMATGQPDRAAAWFEVLRANSKRYTRDAQYYIAYVRYTQGRYDEALQGFLPLQDDGKYGVLVPFYIADSYLRKKYYDKAEIVAQNFLSAHPNHENAGELYRILGEVYYAFYHDNNRAIASFEQYLSTTDTPRRDARYMLGISYYNAGIYSKAASTLALVVGEDDAVTQNANLHIGLAYLQLADKGQARMAFEQAAASGADRKVKEQAAYNYALSVHETAFSSFSESVNAYEGFLNAFPDSEYADKISGYLTDVYFNAHSYEASLSSIERIARPNAKIMAAKQLVLYKLGTMGFTNAHYAQATGYFDRAIEIGQYDAATLAETYYWRGEAKSRSDEEADARRDYLQYLQRTTQKETEMYALAHYNLGYIAFNQKDYTNARDYFTRFITLSKGSDRTVSADAYNRIGDSYFHVRAFDSAKRAYSQAEALNTPVSDYAFYQLALTAGIEKDYAGKVTLLNRLAGRFPSSEYIPGALYEKGRAYVQMENNRQAIAAFEEMIAKYPNHQLTRKAAAETGLLYYQDQEYDRAVAAYKKVIEKYPGSDEARLAVQDLKSIFIDRNRVDEFASLAKSLPGAVPFEVTEQDSLTYVAAEKVFMNGRIEEAKHSFAKYIENYPEGAFTLNAYYYLIKIAKEQKQYSKLIEYSDRLLKYPDSPYAEEVLVMRGEILLNAQAYADALATYKQLHERASTGENRVIAATGMLRSAYLSLQDTETVRAASLLLAEPKLTSDLAQEAAYFRARAYLRLNEQAKALADLKTLAKDTRSSYGAEAKYMIANQYYEAKEYAAAEKELLDFIEKSTPHAYWLARAFILLSDTYTATGKTVEARQYLLSLQQNYHADDDIKGMIEKRLKK